MNSQLISGIPNAVHCLAKQVLKMEDVLEADIALNALSMLTEFIYIRCLHFMSQLA